MHELSVSLYPLSYNIKGRKIFFFLKICNAWHSYDLLHLVVFPSVLVVITVMLLSWSRHCVTRECLCWLLICYFG